MRDEPSNYRFTVDAHAIRRFAEAAWDERALYRHGARGAVPVPPTFLGAASTMQGRQHCLLRMGFDVARAFHGAEIIEVDEPIFDGMRLYVEETYEAMPAVEGKRGGHMNRARRRSTFYSDAGNRVAMVDRVILEAVKNMPPAVVAPHLDLFDDGLELRPDPSPPAPVSVSSLQQGDQLPACTFGPVTRSDFVRYGAASGDLTAIHYDEQAARARGYSAPFAMGMLSAAFTGHMLGDWVAMEPPWKLDLRFRDLLWPGDYLMVSGAVRSALGAGVVIDVVCDVDGRVVTSASADIRSLPTI